jgi:hypothetical protein
VFELKNACYPAISPKKVRLSFNETPLLDDFQPLSDIVEKDQVFLCEILPDSIPPPSISIHPSASSGQSFMPNDNEWLFHFEGEVDATFHYNVMQSNLNHSLRTIQLFRNPKECIQISAITSCVNHLEGNVSGRKLLKEPERNFLDRR